MQSKDHLAKDREPSHYLHLPPAPPELLGPVKAWREDVAILTYEPGKPDLNPMFLEKRVYQGSSGRVYPLPVIDRISTEPRSRKWKAIHIENEFLRLMILPEIGGRIHVGYDKTTGYDFFYRQNVIKPALVGLAGPWISGGVEFNWPQHHRPATFMPVETEIEERSDGSITVWCSDHDPMLRMKGMHGICLYPGRAVLELKVRLFNRTEFTQTFLWWANVATRVHEQYQSFFPTDVRFVADHAKRAITSFPLSDGCYYGVNYGERARCGVPADEQPRMFVPDGSYPANDLSWYSNIPVPTSYMVTDTEGDFLGGYDHRAEVGVVHVANHHISPGKKQWTWGNNEFGYAWDRSLTDHDGPYVELMAGVYTDNQPDFSFLAPWETKTFTQIWYPIHRIGVPQMANVDAALSLQANDGSARLGLCVTKSIESATVRLICGETEIESWTRRITVQEPLLLNANLPIGTPNQALSVVVEAAQRILIEYDPAMVTAAKEPAKAREPLPPEQIESIEELYLTGLHLCQYRHATRQPEIYWQEALRRDPGESRVHNTFGLWRLKRGELESAAVHFEAAIKRLTSLNPNPYDGEAFYNLGVTRRFQHKDEEAYKAFYKATWNAAWRGPAYFALAEMDSSSRRWELALEHVQRSLKAEADNLNARNLLYYILRKLDNSVEADVVNREILSLDPLDIGVRWRQGVAPSNGQECLDLAFDLIRAGLDKQAAEVLRSASTAAQHDGSGPIILFALSSVERRLGLPEADATLSNALRAPLDYCFPGRLEELLLLESTVALHPENGAICYLLGNWLYNFRRHEEAIAAWEEASRKLPDFATVWRNLAIAYFNVRGQRDAALQAFDRAFEANPADSRLLYERDCLWKRIGKSPQFRHAELLRHPDLISQRDDLSVELATLLNQMNQPLQALDILLHRKFQPWEGGEGLVLGQYVRARLLLGRHALEQGDAETARIEFHAALDVPENLGEAKHLLANQSDIYFWLGCTCEKLGEKEEAIASWRRATKQNGDFQKMSVRSISDMTYWSAVAHQRLGEKSQAEAILHRIYEYSVQLEATEPKIDYFATSLPTILLLNEDIAQRNTIEAWFLRAQALSGLGRTVEAETLLRQILEIDINHASAADLLDQIRMSTEQITAG
jgi:tetratricopeptide (TPR) repeat protein